MSYPLADINESYTLLPPTLDTKWARVNQAAIGFQESDGYHTRMQYAGGPARSYWQFEIGGIRGVMTHAASIRLAIQVCDARGVEFNSTKIHAAMATDDVLGAAFARLLMLTDPFKLPENQADAWTMYAKRLWRPGKPHPEKWPKSWAFGLSVVAK